MVAGFSVFCLFFSSGALAQQENKPKDAKPAFDAKEIIFGNVLNNHDFHIIDYIDDHGAKHPISIPLPVILYSKQKGLSTFMSSRFHHGEENYQGYSLLTNDKIQELKLDPTKFNAQDIVAVDSDGKIDTSVRIYDVSITRNVIQMIIAMGLFTWVMLAIAKKYKQGQGVTSAPKGSISH